METRQIHIGSLAMGGGAPVCIQSMTNTDTRDIESTVTQIQALSEAGCDLVRMSIYDSACVKAIEEIKKRAQVPLVADIHFDARLAVGSIEAGIDKLRINPGNIGSREKVQNVVAAAKERGVPIWIGVMQGLWKSSCWKNTKGQRQKRWWKARWDMPISWRKKGFMTSCYP